MDLSLTKIKNIFIPRKSRISTSLRNSFMEPEVGFRVSINSILKQIKVSVISARHLPAVFEFRRVEGYIFKVKIFPGDKKYETELKAESWPTYNQEFIFPISNCNSKYPEDQLNGRFLLITGYVILAQKNGKNSYTKEIDRKHAIGSITYNLNFSNFKEFEINNWTSTCEIWNTLKDIRSDIKKADVKKENNKGEIEVGILYKISKDETLSHFQLSILKMRCTKKTLQMQSAFYDKLYIKIIILKEDKIIAKGKTEKFKPSITQRFNPKSTNIQSSFETNDLDKISLQVLLSAKTGIKQKFVLGKIELSSNSRDDLIKQWNQSIASPNIQICNWQLLE